ncbi:MAG: hypothetical protein C0599_17990 [Salinivirgaceae bacterium]|nr:MAG: hypothetical protein C0599_17990 [Salinivirgaceae bacterium]
MNTHKETAQQILRYLFTNANGDSADAIKKYQGNELPGFGIMYPQLKELAAKYEPNNDVAIELITKNTREARMMAMILAIPENLSETQLIQLIEGAVTEELKNLLARHIIAQLLHSNNYEYLNTLFTTEIFIKGIVQSFRIHKTLPDFNHCILILRNYLKEHTENSIDILNFLEAIYRKYNKERVELKAAIENFINEFPQQKSQLGLWLSNIKELEDLY